MNWTTLYIAGRADFRDEVLRKLENSKVDFMPGYMDGNHGKHVSELYWVDERVTVRELKEAIGGKLIWKYRLRFYTNLEEALGSGNITEDDSFTKEEQLMLDAMRKSA